MTVRFFAPQCSANSGDLTRENDTFLHAPSTPLPARLTAPRSPSGGAGFSSYELRKTQWVLLNPDASSKQYEQAMRELAEELGV